MDGTMILFSYLRRFNYKQCFQYLPRTSRTFKQEVRYSATTEAVFPEKEKSKDTDRKVIPLESRFVYPEFLPDPAMATRNHIRERLERLDMLQRRSQVNIPEFYVGSIMAVTTSDRHWGGKLKKFVGICIQRSGCGLRASFLLRNVIDHQGIEVLYEMYDPTIQNVEVLRLEKRLDDELLYLRDALPEYSTFPLDMEQEFHPEGTPVPVNPIKVKLKPRPWYAKWERENLKGVQEFELPEKRLKKAAKHATPWEAYDLMKQYRKTIPEEEQAEIFSEIYSELHNLELTRKKMKRKRTFVKPKKTA